MEETSDLHRVFCSSLLSLVIKYIFPSLGQHCRRKRQFHETPSIWKATKTTSQALHVTVAEVNLSITIYMVFQGLAPSFWGTLADGAGRRPVFIATFCVYEVANIGLALTNDLTTLMVFRALQAIGSSATISIGQILQKRAFPGPSANSYPGAGVIADLTTPDERGGLIGIFGGSEANRLYLR